MARLEMSRLEHRSNMLLSTLRSFIRATGSELQFIATFPDAEPVQLLVGSRVSDESLERAGRDDRLSAVRKHRKRRE